MNYSDILRGMKIGRFIGATELDAINLLLRDNERLRDMVAVYADRFACIDTGETGKLESFTVAAATGE